MPLYNPPNLTEGVDQTLVSLASEVPSFIIGLLLFVWGIVFIGGATSQKRRTGFTDIPLWATLASVSTLLVSLLMTLKNGLINLETLGIVVAITVFSGLWLFLSKGRGEV